ncbi:LOW QUALITY PROTEIN: hypothetical protein AAY473_020315 [Plecturocebus cupreus]
MLSPPLTWVFENLEEEAEEEEEKAALQCINSALWGEAKVIWDSRASQSSHALPLPAAGTASSPLPLSPQHGCTAGEKQVTGLPGPRFLPGICCSGRLWEEAQLTRPLLRESSGLFTFPTLSLIHLANPCSVLFAQSELTCSLGHQIHAPLLSAELQAEIARGRNREKPGPCASRSCSCAAPPPSH